MLENRQNLNFIIDYLYLKPTANNKVHHLWQDFIGEPTIIANTANTDGSQLPQVVVINLGDGNIESTSDAGGNRF